MCGRYTLIRLADFTDMFPWIRPPSVAPPARYNIAPTQPVAAVANDGKNQIDYFRWGLVPSWAKDVSIGAKMINARAETVAEKPAFRTAFKRRRCLIPTSGFYEWKKNSDGRSKTPMYIRRKDRKPFAFAGLWEIWQSPDGSELPTCTIITGKPNELMKNIHDRMAVILPGEKYKQWIDPKSDGVESLLDLLEPFPAGVMEAFAVSKAVNTPSNDREQLIERVEESAPLADEPKSMTLRSRKPKADSDQPGLF